MSTIALKCQDQTLTFEHTPVIASGGKAENFVKFDFCPLWDGCTKTAVFWNKDNDVVYQVLDDGNTCELPPEATAQDGTIYFGVLGVFPDKTQRCSFAVPYWIGAGVSDPTVEVVDFYTHLLAELAGITSAIPSSQKGQAGGVATLDSSGKIPVAQTPLICPTLEVTAEQGTDVTVLTSTGETVATVSFAEDGTKLVSLPSFDTYTVQATRYTEHTESSVTVDTVRLYPLTFELAFTATLVVWTEPATADATVTFYNAEGATAGSVQTDGTGLARIDVHDPGTYTVAGQKDGFRFTSCDLEALPSSENHGGIYCLDIVLENNSWAAISAASKQGLASEVWQVGDVKTATCTDGSTRTFIIAGFDHDTLADASGKAGITFVMNEYVEAMQMRPTNTNAGGFLVTDPCLYLNDTLLNTILPDDLRGAALPVRKITAAGNSSTVLLTETVTVFLLSQIEVMHTGVAEGDPYPYFATAGNRKFGASYWLRSPASGSATDYNYFYTRGGVRDAAATTATYKLRYGFCV